jgi:hypothetical protein
MIMPLSHARIGPTSTALNAPGGHLGALAVWLAAAAGLAPQQTSTRESVDHHRLTEAKRQGTIASRQVVNYRNNAARGGLPGCSPVGGRWP